MGRTKGGSTVKYIWPWMRMVCRSELLLQQVPQRDCTQAAALIDGIAAQFLLADRGYDSNEILDKAVQAGCEAVIPPRRNRKKQRDYDKDIYRVRHLVENAFLHLKRWRGYSNTICQNSFSIRCCRAGSLYSPLAESFGITRVDTI